MQLGSIAIGAGVAQASTGSRPAAIDPTSNASSAAPEGDAHVADARGLEVVQTTRTCVDAVPEAD